MSTMTLEQKILAIPAREEFLGGQYYKYVRLEEVLATIDANLAQPAQAVDVGAIREVIESHVEEAKKLAHDPESQDYLHEQADKLTRAISDEKAGPVGGWQPIETAPTKGREMILLLTPSRFPQVAYSNTWWTSGFSVECKPTHWMLLEPLPAFPAPDKEGM